MNFVLIEALTFGLGKLVKAAESLNINLTLITYDPNIYNFELSNINSKNFTLIKANTFDKEEVIRQCEKLENFNGIINLTDTWTNMVVEISEHFGLKGQNPESTKICRNKDLLRKSLFNNNLTKGISKLIDLQESSIDINQISTNLDYPLIVKDPNGTGSKSVWFAEDAESLKNLLNSLIENNSISSILIETYFKGTLFSAETISYKGETKLLSISSRLLSDMPKFMEKAISLPISNKIKSLNGIDNWIKTILSSISYTDGFAHTEFIVTDYGFEVVEVNPRLGGVQIGEALCQSYNYNFYKAFLEMAMGNRPELLDMKLAPQKYTGQVFIYAKNIGKFSHLDTKYINSDKTTIYPCASDGKEIKNLDDQSACVAILLTMSESTEMALLDAISEANKVQVIMR